MNIKTMMLFLGCVFSVVLTVGQTNTINMNGQSTQDSIVIRKIFDEALANGKSYELLGYLSKEIGARLSGSPQAAKAIEWVYEKMKELELDTVFLQETMVPYWVRGEKEVATIITSSSKTEVPVCALGGSVGTGENGITAEVVEIKSFEELKTLGKEKINGKIVFFNRPMDPTKINTFEAYGGAVDQRSRGAIEAAQYGAKGVIIRSMTLILDDHPHTGVMQYEDSIKKIPAAAISTNGAELLSQLLKKDTKLQIDFKMNCETLPDTLSYNVVGEIRGSEFPNEIIVVGGHFDSWDLGEGAHDDGAGCMQSVEVLRIFKALNIRPKRTIRAVMFINEENGLRGGMKYAELAKQNGEKHIAALESDAGAFTPKEFHVDANEEIFNHIKTWEPYFYPYGLYQIQKGGGGGDIWPLKEQGVTLIGFRPDSQRYFDFHHAATDTFEAINKRELEMGGACITALIYLLSEYGL